MGNLQERVHHHADYSLLSPKSANPRAYSWIHEHLFWFPTKSTLNWICSPASNLILECMKPKPT